jgi:site-specific recombinase XerD
MPYASGHTFHQSFATDQWDIRTIQELLGHKDTHT